MRHRMNVYLPPELLQEIADLAARKKLSQSAIMEAAVTSFLSPDGADRREAAFARRLDRLTRQVQRLERNTRITVEMMALFVRFWLTVTPSWGALDWILTLVSSDTARHYLFNSDDVEERRPREVYLKREAIEDRDVA